MPIWLDNFLYRFKKINIPTVINPQTFEDFYQIKINEMLHIVARYIKYQNSVDSLFIFIQFDRRKQNGGVEFFFDVDGYTMEKNIVGQVLRKKIDSSDTNQAQCLLELWLKVEELETLFKKYDKPIPYQLRIKYICSLEDTEITTVMDSDYIEFKTPKDWITYVRKNEIHKIR